jgi:hypothetical protein
MRPSPGARGREEKTGETTELVPGARVERAAVDEAAQEQTRPKETEVPNMLANMV